MLEKIKAVGRDSGVERPPRISRGPEQIVAPGSVEPFGEAGRGDQPGQLEELSSLPPKLVILALVELLLPASGLLLGLQLWNGSFWWLLAGAGALLSVLLGYAFRSDVQLYPLDASTGEAPGDAPPRHPRAVARRAR